MLHENDSIHKPSPQHNRRNSGVKWQTNTSTRRILRLKTPTPTKAHKSELVLKARPADFQHSPLPPQRFDQEGKITPGINTKNEGPHVRLSFTLYENRVQRNRTQKELDEIFSVVPTCTAVTLMNPFLILQYETLPDRPWPITVAAIPVYLTTDPEDFPLELGLPAAGPPLLLPCELERWKTPCVDTMHQLFQAFDERKVDIKGFQWFGVRLLGEVNGDAPAKWESYFPHRVNNVHVSYVFHNITSRRGARRWQLLKHA